MSDDVKDNRVLPDDEVAEKRMSAAQKKEEKKVDKQVDEAAKASEADADQAPMDGDRLEQPKPNKDVPPVVNPRNASADPGQADVVAATEATRSQLEGNAALTTPKDGPVEGPHTDPEAKADSDRQQDEANQAAKDNDNK